MLPHMPSTVDTMDASTFEYIHEATCLQHQACGHHQVLTAKLVAGGGWGGVCRVARPDPNQVASEQGR